MNHPRPSDFACRDASPSLGSPEHAPRPSPAPGWRMDDGCIVGKVSIDRSAVPPPEGRDVRRDFSRNPTRCQRGKVEASETESFA